MTPDTCIAIVGMSGRFPGARTLADYWRNLRDGVCSITDLSAEQLLAAGVGADEINRADYVASKGVLDDADRFEPELFGFTDSEAAALDPQHRVLLETAWATLEDGGFDPRTPPARTGVYVGGSLTEHGLAAHHDPDLRARLGELQAALLADRDFLAPWISYRFGLDGPSMTIQTACSTSLTAVHVAAQALLTGECDAAIAGGVSIPSVRDRGYRYHVGGVRSPDGRCRPFDEAAGGTLTGSGAGLVLLRRLEDALADGDPVRAVIVGSAVSNDGNAKVGFTAPSIRGQRGAIVEAWSAAGMPVSSAQYLEMHGTATALGDRVELAAAKEAYGSSTPGNAGCAIGSVKSNIGHLDVAAGIAGLIKVVLMLQHRTLVPTVGLTRPHPDLHLDSTSFHVQTKTESWDQPAEGPRLGGVSSVGLGGTNVHVVVAENPQEIEPGANAHAELLTVAGRTPEHVTAAARELAGLLRSDNAPKLSDIAHTLRVARTSFPLRAHVVADSSAGAAAALQDVVSDALRHAEDPPSAPVLLFPGQTTQYDNAGRGLYQEFPMLRHTLDECADILLSKGHADPRPWLAARPVGTRYWQPALVALQYAAACQWREWGIVPAAVCGHSIGEYTAACLAGVISLPDALELAALRGTLVQDTAEGRMVAVAASVDQVAGLLGPELSVAAINGPRSVVLSGSARAVAVALDALNAERIACRLLDTDRAFHSPNKSCRVRRTADLAGSGRRQVSTLFSRASSPAQRPCPCRQPGEWIAAGMSCPPMA